MRTLTHVTLCFFAVFLFLSYNSLHAQTPQTIIIVTDNGHGNGGVSSGQQFEREPQDPKDPKNDCQPVLYVKGVPNQVNFDDIIAYSPGHYLHHFEAVRVEIRIDHPYVSGGMTYRATYQVADLNAIDPYTMEIPLMFSTGLPVGFPQSNLMVIDLEIHVRSAYAQPNDYWDGFQRAAWGSYTVHLCSDQISATVATHSRTGVDTSPSFGASPNPFTDYVELSIPGNQENKPSVEVYNLNGERLILDYQTKFAGVDTWLGSINTKALSPGFYLIRVSNGSEVFNKKIVKY